MGLRCLIYISVPFAVREGLLILGENTYDVDMEKAILLKVKDGQWEAWKNWCTELNTTLRKEAILTLEEERVFQELTIGFEVDGDYFVIGFMDGECLPANMERDINKRHNAMKHQCLERVGNADVLYNIKQ